jgi:hypothetical protein
MREKVDYKPIVAQAPSIISTAIRGWSTTRRWPMSGTFFLPVMEMAGERRTPTGLFPVVQPLYEYIRKTDEVLDTAGILPSLAKVESATGRDCALFLSAVTVSLGSEFATQVARKVEDLKHLVYDISVEKESWGTDISFDQAYRYRHITNYAASSLPVMVWSESVGIKGFKRNQLLDTATHVAMALQHTDDLFDWSQDPPNSGNLVHAAMNEASEILPGQGTLARIGIGIDRELQEIRQMAPKLDGFFTNFTHLVFNRAISNVLQKS